MSKFTICAIHEIKCVSCEHRNYKAKHLIDLFLVLYKQKETSFVFSFNHSFLYLQFLFMVDKEANITYCISTFILPKDDRMSNLTISI